MSAATTDRANRRVGLLAAMLAVGLLAASSGARLGAQESGPGQDPEARVQARAARSSADSLLEARTTAVASALRCPVCQGLSIQDSPSELAQQMRGLVKEQLRQGKSEAEVRAYFISKYGEWILLEPEASGFNLVAYLAPLGALLVGGGIVAVAVRRWTAQPAGTEPVAAPSLAPEDDER